MDYTFKYVDGHIEVYNQSGVFLFSADSQQEALHELRTIDPAA